MMMIGFSITQRFSGASEASNKGNFYPRQIDLSGNVFHFAMPEDFSRDMPAYDMVEKLDISDLSKFDDPEESFRIDYAEGNPMSGIVAGEWLQSTNTELMNRHADEILTCSTVLALGRRLKG